MTRGRVTWSGTLPFTTTVVRDVPFDEIEILGKPALLIPGRVDRKGTPVCIFAYDIRHDDEGEPATIEDRVAVNHYATVLLNAPLNLPDTGFIPITTKDLNYIGIETTIREFKSREKHAI